MFYVSFCSTKINVDLNGMGRPLRSIRHKYPFSVCQDSLKHLMMNGRNADIPSDVREKNLLPSAWDASVAGIMISASCRLYINQLWSPLL